MSVAMRPLLSSSAAFAGLNTEATIRRDYPYKTAASSSPCGLWARSPVWPTRSGPNGPTNDSPAVSSASPTPAGLPMERRPKPTPIRTPMPAGVFVSFTTGSSRTTAPSAPSSRPRDTSSLLRPIPRPSPGLSANITKETSARPSSRPYDKSRVLTASPSSPPTNPDVSSSRGKAARSSSVSAKGSA